MSGVDPLDDGLIALQAIAEQLARATAALARIADALDRFEQRNRR